MTREGWTPISADPSNRRARMATVERRLREHRVERGGETPCPDCGGGFECCEVRDVCDCGTTWVGQALAARCLAVANRLAEETA